jgi:hypothetical protein
VNRTENLGLGAKWHVAIVCGIDDLANALRIVTAKEHAHACQVVTVGKKASESEGQKR